MTELYRRWLLELWHGSYDVAEEILTEDFAGHWPERDVEGRDALVELIRETRAMFESLEFELEVGPFVNGEFVAARWTGRRPHRRGRDAAARQRHPARRRRPLRRVLGGIVGAVMSDPNIFETEWEPGAPPGLRGARVGAAAGATELGATLYELRPGTRDLALPPALRQRGAADRARRARRCCARPRATRRLEPGAVVAFLRGAGRRAPGAQPRRASRRGAARLDHERARTSRCTSRPARC